MKGAGGGGTIKIKLELKNEKRATVLISGQNALDFQILKYFKEINFLIVQ